MTKLSVRDFLRLLTELEGALGKGIVRWIEDQKKTNYFWNIIMRSEYIDNALTLAIMKSIFDYLKTEMVLIDSFYAVSFRVILILPRDTDIDTRWVIEGVQGHIDSMREKA